MQRQNLIIPEIMDIDSVRRRHPTPASPIVSRRPAAMPVTPRSGATPTAPRQMRFVPAAAPQVTPVTPQATPASPVMAPRRWGIKQCANFAAPSEFDAFDAETDAVDVSIVSTRPDPRALSPSAPTRYGIPISVSIGICTGSRVSPRQNVY